MSETLPTASTESPQPRASSWVPLLIVLAALPVVAIYALDWYSLVFVRSHSIGYEGPILWAAKQLAVGGNIYPSSQLAAEPWITILYPPLYMLVAATGVIGGTANYALPRLFSCLASAATAWFFYRLLRLQECPLPVAVATTASYFSLGFVVYQSAQCRPDMLSLAFGVSSLYYLVKAVRRDGIESLKVSSVYTAAVLCALSMFAKQQGIVFALAIPLTLLAARQFKAAFGFAGALILLLGILLGGTQLISGGLVENLSFLLSVHPQPQVFVKNIGSLGLDWLKVLAAVALAPVGIMTIKKPAADERLPLLIFFVGTLIFLYTMALPASNINHLLAAGIGLFWWLGLTLSRLPLAVCLALALLSLVNFMPLVQEPLAVMKLEPRAIADRQKILSLNLVGKPVLTDDVYLNLWTGSKPVFIDCATFINVWRDTGIGFSHLVDEIAEHKFAAIIINLHDVESGGDAEFWPRPVVAAIKKHYVRKDILFCGPWVLVLFLPPQEPAPSTLYTGY